jgi:hypothetical protein
VYAILPITAVCVTSSKPWLRVRHSPDQVSSEQLVRKNLGKLNVVQVSIQLFVMGRPLVQVVTSAPVAWVTSFILTTSVVRTPVEDS